MSYSIKSIRKQFAEQGVFYTDERLARMLADEIYKTSSNIEDVYDPTCGAGNLLAVFPDDVAKYGQEINPEQAEVAMPICHCSMTWKQKETNRNIYDSAQSAIPRNNNNRTLHTRILHLHLQRML